VAAAGLALDGDGVVQNVEYAKLLPRLKALGQVVEWTGPTTSARAVEAIAPSTLPGVVLDDADGKKTGEWHSSSIANARKVGVGYLHDGNTNQGGVSIAFTPDLPAEGEYEIFLIAPPNPNRATNAPVTISIDGKELSVMVDQRSEEGNGFRSLGRHRLPKGRKTTVTLSNRGASGFVVVDGIQFLPH
jgi:hypothetical protein